MTELWTALQKSVNRNVYRHITSIVFWVLIKVIKECICYSFVLSFNAYLNNHFSIDNFKKITKTNVLPVILFGLSGPEPTSPGRVGILLIKSV